MAIALAAQPQMPDWVMQLLANGTIQYSRNLTTDATGVWNGTLPEAGLKLIVQARTPGEYSKAVSTTGTAATVTFRKFKSGGLGATVGTLLTVSIFEDVTGVVNFDLIATRTV